MSDKTDQLKEAEKVFLKNKIKGIEQPAFSENNIMSKPQYVIEAVTDIYSQVDKGPMYDNDLFILMSKWMYENICAIKPDELYPYGFVHKKNSNNELIKALNKDESIVINFVSGKIDSYKASTGFYDPLIIIPDIDAFDDYIGAYMDKINKAIDIGQALHEYCRKPKTKFPSVRMCNTFRKMEAITIYDISKFTKRQTLLFRGCGKKTLMEIEDFLSFFELELKR